MSACVFFYGTLMKPFNMSGRRLVDEHLRYVGRGRITAAMFDLGSIPPRFRARTARWSAKSTR